MTKEIEELIAQAKARVVAMTSAQRAELVRQQRRSYVIGEAGMGSDADEAAYAAAHAAGDTATLERLEAAARAREQRAAAVLDGMEL